MKIHQDIISTRTINRFKNLENDFNEIHNNLYGYNNVIYRSMNEKISITCKEHGDFFQTPSSHLRKRGCPKCNGGIKKSQQDVLYKCNIKHNNIYNYDKAKYTGDKNNIIITCKEHGDFLQIVNNHLNGSICPTCANISRSSKMLKKDVILRFIEVHADLYNYDKFIYNGIFNKGLITCKKHGDFLQSAQSHIKGHGCSKCAGEKTNYEKYKDKPTILYYIKINNLWKIGITLVDKRFKTVENNVIKGRFKKEYRGNNIEVLKYSLYSDGFDAYLKEQNILSEYDKEKYMYISKDMNWFSGYTELFNKDILSNNII